MHILTVPLATQAFFRTVVNKKNIYSRHKLNVSGRCEVRTHHWAQCNDVPVKYARFPVTGLVEGRSYIFRVRALNKAGVSRASRVSEAVVAMDPSDRARLRGEGADTAATCCYVDKANGCNFLDNFFFFSPFVLSVAQLALQHLGLGLSNSQRRIPQVQEL